MMAYHGTDYDVANKIVTNGFLFNRNPKHWLGNGIYLYQDFSLAEWWTTRPTNKFGKKINNPAIISCDIDIAERKILNLLRLKDYCEFSSIFEEKFYPLYKSRRKKKRPTWNQLRCAYCDFLSMTYNLDAIIGNFNKQDQPYLPLKHHNEFDDFLLQYTEVQICVFNKEILTIEKVEKLNDRR